MDKFSEALGKGNFISKNILESCGFQNRDALQKSHVEVFGDSQTQRGFVISKKGSEIKTKLKLMLEKEVQESTIYYNKAMAIAAKIGCEPTKSAQEFYYYLVDGWEDKIGNIPNVYDYESVCESCNSDLSLSVPSEPKSGDIRQLKDEYNYSIRQWIETKREQAMLNTMINNLSDTKEYDLTVREAVILGF